MASFYTNASADDALETISSGAVSITVQGNNTADRLNGTTHGGFRFPSVTVAQGTQITSAVMRFESLAGFSGFGAMTDYTLYGQDVDNASQFSTSNGDISGRTRTTATVSGSNLPADDTDWEVTGVDVTSIVQEILDRGGWSSGNAMALLFIGDGTANGQYIQPYHWDYFSGFYQAELEITVETPADTYSVTKSLAYEVVTQDSISKQLRYSVVPFGTTQKEYSIASGNDDAVEALVTVTAWGENLDPGDVLTDKTSLNVDERFAVGLRFTNVDIPQGATISAAYIVVDAFNTSSAGGPKEEVDVYGEDVDNSSAFAATSQNITNRTKTTAFNDEIPEPGLGDAWQPEVTSIVQEIINRGGWSSGNALTIMFIGTTVSEFGGIEFHSYEATAGNVEPRLVIQYVDTSIVTVQKSLAYAVTDGNAVQKSIAYTVKQPESVQKSTRYTVVTPTTVQKSLQYAVVVSGGGGGGPWYSPSWTNRVKITVAASEVDADLTDFPVYVDLSDLPAGFNSTVRPDGGDIRVTTSDGETEIPREVVFYLDVGPSGEMYFKAPTLSSSTNTDFYIYYGNSSATDYAVDATYGAENVWTNGYVGVYHLQGGSLVDSTSNDNDLTAQGGLGAGDATAGHIAGTGLTFSTGKYATLADNISMDWEQVTFSAWAQTATLAADGTIGAKNGGGTSEPLLWFDEGVDDFTFGVVTGSGFINSSSGGSYTTRSINTWYYAAGTYDGSQVRVRVNGVQNFSTNATGGITNTNVGFGLGNQTDGGRQLSGKIDEFRMADTGRTNAWLDAEYSNQNDSTTFYSVGTQEAPASGGIQKSLEYAIAPVTTESVTKSLEYAVFIPENITKSVEYTIVDQSALNKQTVYTVLTDNSTTKSVTYTVTDLGAVTKSLQYTVVTDSSVSKTSTYGVVTSDSTTKSTIYTVTVQGATTKNLTYTVSTSASVTKGVDYYMLSLDSLTKSVTYAVTTDSSVAKSVDYYVVTPTDDTKSLTYTVTDQNSVTASLAYVVVEPNIVTRDLEYAVATTETVNKTLEYTLIQTKSDTKQLSYRIVTTKDITKNADYSVTASDSIQKAIVYTIEITPSATTKGVEYSVVTNDSVTLSTQYTVVSPQDVQHSLIYAIASGESITKGLVYEIDRFDDYTRENTPTLPADDSNLATDYTDDDRTDVATQDTIRVGVSGTGDFLIHQYKEVDKTSARWIGRSSLAPASSTIYLQIYNYNTASWDTVDSDSSTGADADFELSGGVGFSVRDNYLNGDNVATFRIYQEIA